jgi:nitric oxide reductase subunit B
MKLNYNLEKYFLILALLMLITGLVFGVLASQVYLFPNFLKSELGFQSLRPLHVSSVMFWILLGGSGAIYCCFKAMNLPFYSKKIATLQLLFWLIAIVGIFYSYKDKSFGGREYWEFNPIWAFPIAIAWIMFIINFFKVVSHIKSWPVYVWMWMTGIIFFLFTFIENYLWLFPYFRSHFITDMTIQWKVNGSLVGSWNQILYGVSFYLMERIGNDTRIAHSKLAFAMFFLGLTNLMFNWSHHIYTLPTDEYIRHVGYLVSMTEWIILIKIIYNWKSSLQEAQKYIHYFPYRYLMMMDFWVFLNLFQAILMSIPAINIYTHGTHVTVAHAMGTTIGINSMILFAVYFEFLVPLKEFQKRTVKIYNITFWSMQLSLFVFCLTLNIIGIQKGIWQQSSTQIPFSKMMISLKPLFNIFALSGLSLMVFMLITVFFILKFSLKKP